MAFVLADRVKETTIVVGTGAATLLGASSGYQSFSAGVGASNTTYYTIADQSGSNWEVGYGTLDVTGLILTRTTVISSSNSGSAVTFTTGTKDVWCDYTAKKAVTTDTLAYPPAIGSTTPAAGKFTTLEATGTSSLGTASAQYIQAVGDALYPQLLAAGSGTNIPLVLQPKGTGALQAQLTDSTATGGNARGANAGDWQTSRNTAASVASGQVSVLAGGEYNIVSGYGSLVSGGRVNTSSNSYSALVGGQANTASGGWSALVGGYSNTGAGFYNIITGGYSNAGTASAAVTTQSGTMNATTAVTLSGSNANIKVGQLIQGTSINNAPHTYVAAISGTSLTLSQNASGSSTSTLSFYTPHGVVVGGGNNQATGAYSFIGGGGDAGTASQRNIASGDWSVVAGGTNNTASGLASFVAGGGTFGSVGSGNLASGTSSSILGGWSNISSGTGSTVVGGNNNTSNGSRTTALGSLATTRGIAGMFAMQACNSPISQTGGINQASLLILARQTTDATATVLASDSSAASGTNQVILPNNSAYYFKVSVIAGVTGAGNTKAWTLEGAIKRGANAGTTAIVGTVTTNIVAADAGASTWTVTATADTTNGGLAITFTGQAATTIRVVAKCETAEMTF